MDTERKDVKYKDVVKLLESDKEEREQKKIRKALDQIHNIVIYQRYEEEEGDEDINIHEEENKAELGKREEQQKKMR